MNKELTDCSEDGDEAATKDITKLLHIGSLVRAAGFLARALGEEPCNCLVKEAWSTPKKLPEVVQALTNLPFCQVWTTFLGDLLKTAFKKNIPEGWQPRRFSPTRILTRFAHTDRMWSRSLAISNRMS